MENKKIAINLFVKFQFTSLSPDAQCISLGIISDGISDAEIHEKTYSKETGMVAPISRQILSLRQEKSFYAEFSDFDINRCDDWVKENVVGKLKFSGKEKTKKLNEAWPTPDWMDSDNSWVSENVAESVSIIATTNRIKKELKEWLSQFSDYQIQFIGDCATWDWWFMVQLLAEWEETPSILIIEDSALKKYTIEELQEAWRETPMQIISEFPSAEKFPKYTYKTGLPKLPDNISPVPFDLNDLIAIKEGITPKEAFDIERLGSFCQDSKELYRNVPQTHNALFDAKVIKEIYNKLNAGTS